MSKTQNFVGAVDGERNLPLPHLVFIHGSGDAAAFGLLFAATQLYLPPLSPQA